jgi:hypothetical protein
MAPAHVSFLRCRYLRPNSARRFDYLSDCLMSFGFVAVDPVSLGFCCSTFAPSPSITWCGFLCGQRNSVAVALLPASSAVSLLPGLSPLPSAALPRLAPPPATAAPAPAPIPVLAPATAAMTLRASQYRTMRDAKVPFAIFCGRESSSSAGTGVGTQTTAPFHGPIEVGSTQNWGALLVRVHECGGT